MKKIVLTGLITISLGLSLVIGVEIGAGQEYSPIIDIQDENVASTTMLPGASQGVASAVPNIDAVASAPPGASQDVASAVPNIDAVASATPGASQGVTAVVPNADAVASATPGAGEETTASDNPATDSVSIKIIKPKSKIKAGQKYTFKAKISGLKAGQKGKVKWSVSKTKYAKITEKGKLTAYKSGTVYVVAKYDDVIKRVKIKIMPKYTVAIDAGHQARGDSSTEPVGPGSSVRKAKVAGGTSGVVTKVPEYKLTLAVAKKLKKELVQRGYKVVMIRTGHNVNISNKERAIKANKSADICIRLHGDGIGDSSVNGASALYPTQANRFISKLSPASKKLSECVLNAMCKKTKARNRGLSPRDDLTGTNWSTIPVTLIEMGFMSNPAEDRKLQDKEYQQLLAEGMADGIDEYYN